MPNILTSELRHKNIDNFLNTITDESVYFAFSNPDPWTNENVPNIPKDSHNLTSDVFTDMLYAKKVTATNVSRVIKNYGWVSGSRYQQYSSTDDINDLTRIKSFVKAIATATVAGGVVTAITITNPGAEYTSAPAVTISAPASGTTASATANIVSGSVVSITINSGGTGYASVPTVTIDAPSAISNNNFSLRPFYVITDEYNVYKCLGNNSGAASTIKPTSTSTAAGVSETTADSYQWKYMFTLSSNDIERFYTSSWIPVKTLNSNDGSSQSTVQTNAEAGSEPKHGADPVKELNATNVMIKVRVSGNEGSAIVDTNEYRQISVVLDPIFSSSYYTVGATGLNVSNQMGLNASHSYADSTKTYYPSVGKKIIILSGPGKGQIREISSLQLPVVTLTTPWNVQPTTTSYYGIIANSSVINQTVILDLGAVTNGPFVPDSTVTQATSGATGKVVKYDSTSAPKQIYLTSVSGTFNGANNISSGAVSSTVTAVTQPTAVKNLGRVLYIENRKAITRNPDQIEDIKVIIQY